MFPAVPVPREIGLRSLEQALAQTNGEVSAEIHFQPFESNPQMGAEGEDIAEHIARKYGSTPKQLARNQEGIRARGAALGFTFDMEERARIYNTFDAHRLLHWAGLEGRQHELKQALFDADILHPPGRNPSDREVLVDVEPAPASMPRERVRFWNLTGMRRKCASASSSTSSKVFRPCLQ